MTPKEIVNLRFDIEKREREERKELLKEHLEKFHKERLTLVSECGKIGHVEGRLYDNRLGYTWYYCYRCGGRMEETVKSYINES